MGPFQPLLTNASTTVVYPHFVKFSVNGYSHGSMPLRALTMHKGEHVRWYLFSGMNDFDFHTPHWHGNTVVINQMRTDVTAMAPMQMVTADMVPDDPGHMVVSLPYFFPQLGGNDRALRRHSLTASVWGGRAYASG